MRIKNIQDAETFLSVVDACKGNVTLKSQYGDVYNLKSKLAQYVAIAALVGEHGDELELWCSEKEDEAKFLRMFEEHPEFA
ncbi:polya polymerase [Frisingicoccus sp.]|uniref:polya polymerase n=1 Tax=Frisingicoccus sp. TaxID=1918627 RepID=UPI003999B0F7